MFVSPAPNVVVTGAAGWLGQNLVRALAGQPSRRRIRCLVSERGDASMLEVIDPRIEVIAGDVRDPTVVDELFDGIGHASVVHAAGVIHPARFVRELFDVNLDVARDSFAFAGDSPNDAPMFAYFTNAVGVANLRRFLDRVATPPAYITARESGAGFCELVDFLLAPSTSGTEQ